MAQSLGILALLVLLVGLGWFLGFYYSCYGYELEEWQDFSVGYHRDTGRAFLGVYHWDGREETLDIPLPDEVFDCRVTALGGYFGRGVPCAVHGGAAGEFRLRPGGLRRGPLERCLGGGSRR